MNPQPVYRIDIVLPAQNEGESIGQTLREFDSIVRIRDGHDIGFVVCEDGSTDDTVEVIRQTSSTVPLLLITGPQRKGYSRAVIDGFRVTTAPLVGFIDSDGQCDPEDFAKLFALIDDHDLVMGYRHPRADHWIRRLMSFAFQFVYRRFFNVPLRDPSCPYLIIRREALEMILQGNVGILRQGFWWEFVARASVLGLRIVETPVAHRRRTKGVTQVYRPNKIAGIAWKHLIGLIELKREIKGRETFRPTAIQSINFHPTADECNRPVQRDAGRHPSSFPESSANVRAA